MPDICIELSGAQFRRAYLLYVIEICHEQERYFYVGQTGDNRYITARPAFRRFQGIWTIAGKVRRIKCIDTLLRRFLVTKKQAVKRHSLKR